MHSPFWWRVSHSRDIITNAITSWVTISGRVPLACGSCSPPAHQGHSPLSPPVREGYKLDGGAWCPKVPSMSHDSEGPSVVARALGGSGVPRGLACRGSQRPRTACHCSWVKGLLRSLHF